MLNDRVHELCLFFCFFAQTLLLVTDEGLQSNGRLHFHRHLFVLDQILFDQLYGVSQNQVVVETEGAEAVQHPARLLQKTQGTDKDRHINKRVVHRYVFIKLTKH